MERLGDEVRGSLRAAGVPDAGLLADVTRVWPAAVGPGIAAAAWPARIGRDETLHVNATSSVWAFELTRLEDDIRTRLAASLPGVVVPPRIRFSAGPVPATGAPEEPTGGRAEKRPPSPEELRVADAIAAAVDDERLRELVRRAAAASLSARQDDRQV
jgi:hypothetical protein